MSILRKIPLPKNQIMHVSTFYTRVEALNQHIQYIMTLVQTIITVALAILYTLLFIDTPTIHAYKTCRYCHFGNVDQNGKILDQFSLNVSIFVFYAGIAQYAHCRECKYYKLCLQTQLSIY